MKMYKLILAVVTLLLPFYMSAQRMTYQSFDNARLSPESNSIRFFLQDRQDLMWIGTDKGLYSFDGYESLPHFTQGGLENRVINCGIFYKEDFLLLGTEAGLLLYNYKYDKYVPFEIKFKGDVRAILSSGNDLWIGCSNGLYKYNFPKKELIKMRIEHVSEAKEQIVCALLEDHGFIYVGTFGRFGRFSLNDFHYEQLESSFGNRRIVNALLKDSTRNCIWIGEGNSLTKYSPSSNLFQTFKGFPVVKTIALDCDNNLVLGTDNGFYLYKENEIKHFVHSAQKLNSLANNIVGSTFRDRSGNIWLGTDFGVSVAPRHHKFNFFSISDFSWITQGNQFSSLYRDSQGFYWLGGDNGLIRTRQLTSIDKTLQWYNMEDHKFHISHNRIRDIYEDSEHNLWVATDFGVCRYDYKNEKFIPHSVGNKDNTRNANWAYHILEDHGGNILISSFNGGIFKIKKEQLLGEQFKNVADANYSTVNGLTSNNIDQIVFDKEGNIWALNHNNGIDVIKESTGRVSHFPILRYSNGNIPYCMINDSSGNIWIGFRNGAIATHLAGGATKTIMFEGAENALIESLLEVRDKIWAITTEGLWIIDKTDFSTRHINLGDKLFYSAYYDVQSKQVLLGGADEIAICSPLIYEAKNQTHKTIISSIIVDGKEFVDDTNALSVRYKNRINFSHNPNNITVKFSDLQYSNEDRNKTFVFKLDNDNWTQLKANENAIYLNALAPGTYNLVVGKRESKKTAVEELTSFQVIIHSPWYYTNIAKVIYLIIVIGITISVINYFHRKKRKKFERIEKEKTQEQKRRIDKLATPLVTNVESADEKFLSFITKTIEERIADPDLNVSVLCEVAHVTQKQLYRKVKQLTGLTTVEYIKSIRMKKAAVLLSNKNFTVAEVMYMVGFTNHSYFARCFYSRYGKTPRQIGDTLP